MRQRLKIVVLCLIVLMIYSINALEQTSVSVHTIDYRSTEIHFTLPAYQIVKSAVDGKYQSIEIDEGLLLADTGYPELPIFYANIAVPVDSKVSVAKSQLSGVKFIENIVIEPNQNFDNPLRTFDIETKFYETTDKSIVYPPENIEVGDVQTIRDFQIVTVALLPMRYFPAEQRLEVTEDIFITIEHHSAEPRYQTTEMLSRAFEPMYEHLINNYRQIRSHSPVYQEPSLLIIYGGSPSATLLNNLVNWKKQTGFEVRAVSTSVAGGYSTTAIKNYIQNAYNTWENPPEYVLLIGSHHTSTYQISTYSTMSAPTASAGFGDYQYTHLAGNDALGDVFIGRLSVSNVNDITTAIERIISYERNPSLMGDAWLSRSFLAGDSNQSGVSTWLNNRAIKATIAAYDPEHTFVEHYFSGSDPSGIISRMNSGVVNFNFRGFAGMSGTDPSHIRSLTNVGRLSNCVWITCSTGTINTAGSRIEVVANHSYSGDPAGAITATGMSTSTTHTAYNNALSGAIFYGLYTADMPTMGQATLFSKLYLVSAYSSSTTLPTANGSANWLNLLGDPSLNLYKAKPKTFLTQTPTSIPAGTQGLRLEVIDSDQNPVSEAWVTISTPTTSFISKVFTGTDGVAYLNLDPNLSGALMVVISKAGFVPQMSGIIINNATASVSVTAYEVNDSYGNEDGLVNPGEEISLTLDVKNFFSFTQSDLTATLTSESPFVTITNAIALLDSIPADSTLCLVNAFSFVVSPQTPDMMSLPLRIDIADSSAIWTSYITPVVSGANIEIVSMTTTTNNNFLNINAATHFYFTYKNSGSYKADSLWAEIRSLTPQLTVVDTFAYIGDIYPTETVTNVVDTFTLQTTFDFIPGMMVDAEVIVSSHTGFRQVIPVKMQVSTKLITDPTGPDAYGYVIYDCNDRLYSEAPVYEWHGIRSVGQNININDINATQEEDSKVVQLPFPAFYYGEAYTQVTICSNGWLAFGATEQKDFRNIELPGPIAPRAMIAPYWTDLVIGASQGGGGVYTYNDTTMNAFIIQWDRARLVTDRTVTGITLGDSVTFQVIIYDPTYHITPTGDSPIKIQYHRFLPGVAGSASKPINYITVGFQDHTGIRGLTYVYDNRYTTGSSPLQSGSALYIAPFRGELNVPPPEMWLTPTSKDFGVSTVGHKNEQVFSIINLGDGFVKVNSIQVVGSPAFTLSEIEPLPIDLGYRQVTRFKVTYIANGIFSHNATVIFDYKLVSESTETAHTAVIPLTGYGENTILAENFMTTPPPGWTRKTGSLAVNTNLTDHTSTGWSTYTHWAVAPFPGGGNGCRMNLWQTQQHWLISPTINLQQGRAYNLNFDLALTAYGGGSPSQNGIDDIFAVLISTDNGASWSSNNTLIRYDNDSSSNVLNQIPMTGTPVSLVLEGYSGDVKIAFFGGSTLNNADNYVYVANIRVSASTEYFEPENLSASNLDEGVKLSWDARQHNNLSGYMVYRDNQLITDVIRDTLFIDNNVISGEEYTYFVVAVYIEPYVVSEPSNLVSIIVEGGYVSDTEIDPPLITALYSNYPNPFNPSTTISFAVGSTDPRSQTSDLRKVSIDIYNIKGQLVRRLVNSTFSAGTHKVVWNGTDDNGRNVGSGIYFYRMKTDGYSNIRKMLLIK